MFDTVVIATDGSESAQRATRTAIDLADRFDAAVHALYVVDEGKIGDSPETLHEEVRSASETAGEQALGFVGEESSDAVEAIETELREGDPATEIVDYATEVDADVIATGTRGRHGDHAFLLGSVAEAIVRRASQPVLTVRQLEE